MEKKENKKKENTKEQLEKDIKPKKVKKKIKRNITTGIAYVKATFNNTIISIADDSGNVVAWSSAMAIWLLINFLPSRSGIFLLSCIGAMP